jgi:predicted pyridoxine 5'-phosphate oxidase superfamily flavin-nucleotide-binding protein
MGHRFLELATTPAARAAQAAHGSRAAYARAEGGAPNHDRLGAKEASFIAARDSFYLASVTDTGWPYIQHRGGPAGFLKLLGEKSLGFADLAGNKQYLTLGNIQTDDRVALFLMDYPNRRRLKLLGRMRAVELADGPGLAAVLVDRDYGASVERCFVIDVEAFDWNCPQHITPRFTEAELADALAPVRAQIDQLTRDNAALRARIAELAKEPR